jgi:hypothetical protein
MLEAQLHQARVARFQRGELPTEKHRVIGGLWAPTAQSQFMTLRSQRAGEMHRFADPSRKGCRNVKSGCNPPWLSKLHLHVFHFAEE